MILFLCHGVISNTENGVLWVVDMIVYLYRHVTGPEDLVVTEEKVALDEQLAIARSVWTLLLSSCLYSTFHDLQGYILD